MSIVLATICLNEMEWLPKLYEQHKDWPGMVNWIFVEGADKVYAECNPALVSTEGLSVDGTTEFLENLALKDSRVTHIKYGLAEGSTLAQNKVILRNQYLYPLCDINPEYLVVIDADEFYTKKAQQDIIAKLAAASRTTTSFCFKQHEIWLPASVKHRKLFSYEVVGGYWNVRHVRVWRYIPGMIYKDNHNWPERSNGKSLKDTNYIYNEPTYVHLGFASNRVLRAAKHDYYKARGEATDAKRKMYVECREAFSTWQWGDELPRGATVVAYKGDIPEVFQCKLA